MRLRKSRYASATGDTSGGETSEHEDWDCSPYLNPMGQKLDKNGYLCDDFVVSDDEVEWEDDESSTSDGEDTESRSNDEDGYGPSDVSAHETDAPLGGLTSRSSRSVTKSRGRQQGVDVSQESSSRSPSPAAVPCQSNRSRRKAIDVYSDTESETNGDSSLGTSAGASIVVPPRQEVAASGSTPSKRARCCHGSELDDGSDKENSLPKRLRKM
ncbi:hypothetical protein PM082_006761 [Marasmius tenuissimus]|nr:hypothetical protein PM082_001917 [Marasmius tenuissimus]KAJ8094223.1 hypothetical protein PM082_006761 [Marasmius tenuissimus]